MSAEAPSAARDPDMAVTSAAVGDAAPPRPAFAQDWRRIARMGAVAVLGQFFISLSNMPVRLDGRAIIEGLLSLG